MYCTVCLHVLSPVLALVVLVPVRHAAARGRVEGPSDATRRLSRAAVEVGR